MATALQAKIESLGVKLREENKSKECELLEKDSGKSTCPKKPLLNLDLTTSTRQHRPGEQIEVVCSTMYSLVQNLTCTGFPLVPSFYQQNFQCIDLSRTLRFFCYQLSDELNQLVCKSLILTVEDIMRYEFWSVVDFIVGEICDKCYFLGYESLDVSGVQ